MDRILVQLFKQFFEKTCLHLIKQNYDSLKQWLYFSSIISQDIIDYSKLQKYVHSLPSTSMFNSVDNSSLKLTTNSIKYPFQKKVSLYMNGGMNMNNNGSNIQQKSFDKKDEIQFNNFFDDINIQTSTSILNIPQIPTNNSSITNNNANNNIINNNDRNKCKEKDILKNLEATKHIIFGLNNLHLMFVEHQYEFEFPKKDTEKEGIENKGNWEDNRNTHISDQVNSVYRL